MNGLNGGKPEQTAVIGVDVGGTTITALVVDDSLHVRSEVTSQTDKSSVRHTLDSIAATITQALQSAQIPLTQISAIGIGVPGKVNALTGTVEMAVNLNWDRVPAGELLGQIMGVACYVENDLNLAALGYHHFFTSTDIRNMAYVTVGTGVAAGFILDGRLYRGSNGMAGEFGHMVVDPSGPRCNCGNYGCLETFTAGPAITRAGKEAATRGELEIAVEMVTALDVFNAARAGNPAAQQIITTAGAYLGRGLQALIMAFDVDKIIIGGGIARAGDIFLHSIWREWQRQANLSPLAAEMLKPEKCECALPERNAGAWGGVALARNHRAPIQFSQTAN